MYFRHFLCKTVTPFSYGIKHAFATHYAPKLYRPKRKFAGIHIYQELIRLNLNLLDSDSHLLSSNN